MQTHELSPKASVMIEAMRDIGYSFESAVADVIDNSIAASATVIDVRFGWTGDDPWIAIVDDGCGMTREALLEALRPGSSNPKAERHRDDLGRFGLGLKTASFSQCRELIVLSKTPAAVSCFSWNLDVVEKTDRWNVLEFPDEAISELPTQMFAGRSGTAVIWRLLDRLDVGGLGYTGAAGLNELMDGVRNHISRIFHRFLSGELGLRKIEIRLNNGLIEPFDPFNEGSLATQKLPKEVVPVAEGHVTISPFILPHHSRVSTKEYERLAGPE